MLLRIRVDEDDDGDDDGPVSDEAGRLDEDAGGWLLNPPDAGGVFLRLALVSFASMLLSLFGLVGQLLVLADEPFVDEPHLEDPILGWLWFLSLTATALSTFGYAAWSFRRQRRLERQLSRRSPGPLRRPIRALRIAFVDSDDLDEYERRVQKTVFALCVGVILGYLPAQISLHALGSL